ncbi:MAG: flagellar biosynthesis anti-sigma factor FlgM [Solirubrobacteraceae bacterium]|nr:MAG: hypothetical protein DLM63_00640 [Solirubrobacterales bacterium]
MRIRALTKAIASGSYKVDAADVAEAILRRLIVPVVSVDRAALGDHRRARSHSAPPSPRVR